MSARLLIAAGITALVGISPALAQGFGQRFEPYRGVYPNPYYEGRSGFGEAPQYCQKLCAQDLVPCDPPEFKHADGRCTNPIGRGGVGGGFGG